MDFRRLLFRSALMAPPDTLQSPEGDSIIVGPDSVHRLWRDVYTKGAMAVLLPLDMLFADRAAAAIRFWNTAIGNRAGPAPKPLTPYARGQLILAIRFLDAERDGAIERDMAEYVLNEPARTPRYWLAPDQSGRAQVGDRVVSDVWRAIVGCYAKIQHS